MARVDNRRKGDITIVSADGKNSGTVVLQHGINEDVPAWVVKEQYFKDLAKEGAVSELAKNEEAADSLYELDENGQPVHALDDDGEPMFDEKTGEPIYVPKKEA